MKMSLLCNRRMLWCVVGGFALAATAHAGDDSYSKGSSGQAELKMMDTDHDGSVSAEEHAAGAKQMFQKMDADGDGIVTAKEMDAAHKDMPSAHSGASDTSSASNTSSESSTGTASRLGKSDRPMKSASSKIKMIDTDGDGTITAAEHEAGARKMFDKMDKDGNGKLSAAEIQAGHDKMMTAEDQ
jgi:Ca2+-binding EF-hand superfamily protein